MGTESKQVNWCETVWLYLAPWLAEVHEWPTIGTSAWAALPDDHPAKWAAVLDAAQHRALRLQTNQTR